jgi:peptidoglycan/LPS O-acetylase OafA/YrhL
MKQIGDLTCCRALFAAWVFAYHVNLQAVYAPSLGGLGVLVRHGALGVDGFFILSGMILAHAHPRLAPRFSEMWPFWAKRLVRIYPVHMAMIVLLAALLGGAWLMHIHPREPQRFGAQELLSHLALIQAWGGSDRWSWNYPSWSISAEWAGYLAFPLLWAVVRPRRGIGLAVVIVLAVAGLVEAYRLARLENWSLTYDGGLIRFFPEFVAGMAIVPLVDTWPRSVNGHLAALCGVVLAVAGTLSDAPVVTVVGLWFLLGGLLLASRQGLSPVLARIPALYWLGELSYSFYMSFAVVETLQATIWRDLRFDPTRQPLLYGATMTLGTLALAVASWRFVERPALRGFAVAMGLGSAGKGAPLVAGIHRARSGA